MLRKSLIALTVLMAFPAAPLLAAVEAEEQEGNKQKPKEKKICRSEKVTGSLTRVRRICATEQEWAEMESMTYKSMTDQQRRAAGGYTPP